MFSLEDVQGQVTLHSKYLEKKYNMEKLKENCRNQAEQRVLSDTKLPGRGKVLASAVE